MSPPMAAVHGHQPWTDNGPATTEWGAQEEDTPQPLPLSPNPNHSKWHGQCYNCLTIDHDQSEEAIPEDRPHMAMVYMPESNQMQKDRMDMHRAVVVDARLRLEHGLDTIQAALMEASNTAYPFPLTHMKGTQYLLLLQPGVDHHTSLMSHARQLQKMGYVLFPWNPVVNSYSLEHEYKVWVQLSNMALLMWTIEHLLATATSFGVVLDHVQLTGAASLNKFTMVVAVPKLSCIPRNIQLCVRGLARGLQVQVQGWIEEPFHFSSPMDPTLSN